MSTGKQREMSSQVSKFYGGKSVFITGAAGFLGTILLEILLRCCTDIQRIYLLLRPKKDVQPQDRKEIIFKKELFKKLKEKNPDVFSKVVVVSGDVSEKDLGMNEEDWKKITEEVSVVFHCAAAISFFKPLKFIMKQNVIGTNNILEFCRKLPNFEALVYTSTAFSNCNRPVIDEKVYGLPFTIDEIMELSIKEDDEGLNKLYSKCSPPFPNYYTFSKCVSENLVLRKANDLPVSIVRPSIIICTINGINPGYIEYGSGLVSLCLGIGKGFIRVLRLDGEKRIDYIPADVVANTHILAAYRQVSERLPSPVIYNCTSGELAPCSWREFVERLLSYALKNPVPKAYQKPGLTVCKNPHLFRFLSILDHYTPAVFIDILLWITGRKLRLVKLYRFYDKCMKSLEPFVMNDWEFKCENFKHLPNQVNATDAELFPVDMTDCSPKRLVECLARGAPMLQYSPDGKDKDNRRIIYLRYFLISIVKWSILCGIVSLFYIILF